MATHKTSGTTSKSTNTPKVKTKNKATSKQSDILKAAQRAAQSGKWKPGESYVLRGRKGVIGKGGTVYKYNAGGQGSTKFQEIRGSRNLIHAASNKSAAAAKGRILDMAGAGNISQSKVKSKLREAAGGGSKQRKPRDQSAAARKAWATRRKNMASKGKR